MKAICDLHTHSSYSDGTYTPEQLILASEAAGLSAVALCDHNTVDGLPEFMTAAAQSSVEAVPGIEFSTEYEGTELHILMLFVEERHVPEINRLLDDLKKRKERSNIDLVFRLQQAGLKIDYEQIKGKTRNGFVNRALIAAGLTDKGYTNTIKEAFKRYLSVEAGFYVPPKRPDAYETIRFIKSLGAVAVLAHPFLNLDKAGLHSFLPDAVNCGLDAMETLYPKYNEEETRLAGDIANEFCLLPSGGSDFHGTNKPDIQLGIGRGTLCVPLSYLEALKQCRSPFVDIF